MDAPFVCTFYIQYDAFRSLCLLSTDPSSLEYRMKELHKVNRQFPGQSDVRFDMRAYMTDNPMMLKMRILFDFLYEVGHYVNENEKYRRNAAYFDTVWGEGGPGTGWEGKKAEDGHDYRDECEYLFGLLDVMAGCLRDAGFFVYDYPDEIRDEECPALPRGDRRKVGIDALCGGLGAYLEFVVPRLMGVTDGRAAFPEAEPADGDAEGEIRMFVRNLVNTTRAYLALMCRALSEDRKDLSRYKEDFSDLKGLAAEDGTYGRAFDAAYDDLLEQLYFQRFGGGMDAYYERMSGDGGTLGYAVKILFDKKHYNPVTVRRHGVNCAKVSDGEGVAFRFTFFDIYSDMYLFKEMSRFSGDNHRRRTSPDSAPRGT